MSFKCRLSVKTQWWVNVKCHRNSSSARAEDGKDCPPIKYNFIAYFLPAAKNDTETYNHWVTSSDCHERDTHKLL